ncbi:hypothetical protein H4O20_05175 [Aequorivita sp. 609]|uniref:hypothetical protein n=1 Tax=Aequorivita TaxID=153265 RepID=UPI001607DFF2|nr:MULTISPECIES: hypothetical protein [Aequorivita]MBB6680828.1 hypothetical protein [Aequorivita sp. 609]
MKILAVLGIIVGWFVIGGIINFIAYSDTPLESRGNSKSIKGTHVFLNIVALIAILVLLFS